MPIMDFKILITLIIRRQAYSLALESLLVFATSPLTSTSYTLTPLIEKGYSRNIDKGSRLKYTVNSKNRKIGSQWMKIRSQNENSAFSQVDIVRGSWRITVQIKKFYINFKQSDKYLQRRIFGRGGRQICSVLGRSYLRASLW